MSNMQHLSAKKAESKPTYSRLVTLPPELRNRIYDYVFGDLHDICASFIDSLDNGKWRYTASSRRLALRQTCKLIAN